MKSRQKYSRRAFLQATGASPLLLPLLEPQLARAGCLTNAPKRAVFVLWGNGSLPGNMRENWPSGASETSFTLSDPMKSLEPVKSDLVFIDKLNYQFIADTPRLEPGSIGADSVNGHQAFQGLLTARRYKAYGQWEWLHEAAGMSIDQYIGGELVKRGYGGIPSVYLGVRLYFPIYSVWRAANSVVLPDLDPTKVFAKLFAGKNGSTPDPEFERLQKTRKSVLDSLGRDFDRLGRVLGSDDRARIQKHLDSIRTIEKDLFAVRQPLACKIPDNVKIDPSAIGADPGEHLTNDAPKMDLTQDAKIPLLMKLQTDLLVAAMATDVTRVAVFQFTDSSGSDFSFPWLGLSDNYHTISHNGGDPKVKADTWIYSQWAYLLGQLKNEREGSKSMLDSAVVAFINNMTTGCHYFHDVPAFFAGSCGGYFKTGRTLANRAPGQYHQPLLVSIANAMDVPTTSFGDPEYNSGELPGLRG